jgi:hypothetical protein
MQDGELIVMGTNEAKIKLHNIPIKLDVDYSDSGEIFSPCDPHLNDTLTWEISQNILTIRWQVSGVRAIRWKAAFLWSEV